MAPGDSVTVTVSTATTDPKACTTLNNTVATGHGAKAQASNHPEVTDDGSTSCAPLCALDVKKEGCVVPEPIKCTGGAIAVTIQYTGAPIAGPLTITVKGSSGATATYNLAALNTGDMLSSAAENNFTIDAIAHAQTKLGSQTSLSVNGVLSEIFHTSCSCPVTYNTNLVIGEPMCLDASSPDNLPLPGVKGRPSPLWTLVGLKDPTLGTVNPDPNQCNTELPAPTLPCSIKDDKITKLTLQYVGGGCANSSNTQGTSATCTGTNIDTQPVRVLATDSGGGTKWLDKTGVLLNETFDVLASAAGKTNLAGDTRIRLYDGSTLIENVKFKTDCSKKINTGDIFGGLKVVGGASTKGGDFSSCSDVKYTYTITNNNGPISGLYVCDDKIGPVAGPIDLADHGTTTLEQTVSVCDETTNTVTVYSGGIDCVDTGTECDIAQATVTKAPPPPTPCTGGVIAFKVKYIGQDIDQPVLVTFTGSSSLAVTITYDLPFLHNGYIFAGESNSFTIDATLHGQAKLGTRTTITSTVPFPNTGFTTEISHTSCSCSTYNYNVGQPICLDATSPDNHTGIKGTPSPLFELVARKP
jgi:hypothetical protein